MNKTHIGSSLDDFLKDEGIFEDSQARAVKEVLNLAIKFGHESTIIVESTHGSHAAYQSLSTGSFT